QFSGRILEIGTNKPIANANISFGEGVGTTSLANGTFETDLTSFPAILRISHLAYHPLEIVINSSLQSGMSIYMQPKTLSIDVVEVRGERIKRYNQNNHFYVIDYDFIDDNICLIGYENNQLSKGRVILLSQGEDTLAYLSVNRPKRIYRDAFDNLHLITKDSIFQLFYNNPRFYLLYPVHIKKASVDLFQLKFVSNSKFLFKQTSGEGQSHEYFYIDTINKTRESLKTIYNRDLYYSHRLSAQSAHYQKPIKRLPGRADRELSIQAMEAARDRYEAMVYDISIIHRPINSLIFRKDSGFILMDLVNDQINHFSKDFNPTETIRTKFPKHKQRRKLVIQDALTEKLYWVHYKGSKVLLGEIDPFSGKIIQTIETPSMPFIENIKIRNGIIWFTYQPRLGETVRSLYRMK
ncbi:MAG: carboxypeptidase-like regulatory domain-containing protein, partial [Bacteroidota bacterium]|nr:carboxypeptidase-like regulatory domain-containing protein [Bacteroidota bacterium]